MTEEEYRRLGEMVSRELGLVLRGDKQATIRTKLSYRLEVLGLRTYSEYIKYIERDPTGQEILHLASFLANSETYFFRERHQLDLFAELLRDVRKERLRREERSLKVLSVGCAGGEEPYTLNIIIKESGLFAQGWDVSIIGIDVNRDLIEKARKAVYTDNSFRKPCGSENMPAKYFSVENNTYTLHRSFLGDVSFVHANVVAAETFSRLKNMDFIFFRNVLIYMTDEASGKMAENLYHSLSDKGYLFIGSSESLMQRTDLFVHEYRDGVIVYRKNPTGISMKKKPDSQA